MPVGSTSLSHPQVKCTLIHHWYTFKGTNPFGISQKFRGGSLVGVASEAEMHQSKRTLFLMIMTMTWLDVSS